MEDANELPWPFLPACGQSVASLLRFAQSGDQRALDELCRRGWRPVYRSFAMFTRDQAEAEDLTHEVFLRMFDWCD